MMILRDALDLFKEIGDKDFTKLSKELVESFKILASMVRDMVSMSVCEPPFLDSRFNLLWMVI